MGLAPSLKGGSLPTTKGMNKTTANRRVPPLALAFAGASTINFFFLINWLLTVGSKTNNAPAAAIGATFACNNGNARPSRDEVPLLRIDLPKFEKLPLDGGQPILAWEVAPRRGIDQKDAPLPATLCSCMKCGTTSFYNTLYEMTHGKPWPYSDFPWIQNITNVERWTDVHAARKSDWDNFAGVNGSEIGTNSFALVRDPKERILSAWKSKIQCSLEGRDREWKFVYPLMKLAGMNNLNQEGMKVPRVSPVRLRRRPRWEPCLDVSTFLLVMFNIHLQGKQGLVNGHFRPQHLWCFAHAPPEKWTHVVTAKSLDAACRLESVVMGKGSHTRGEDCAMEKRHATKDISAYANLTAVDMMLLDAITREEYKVLEPYL